MRSEMSKIQILNQRIVQVVARNPRIVRVAVRKGVVVRKICDLSMRFQGIFSQKKWKFYATLLY